MSAGQVIQHMQLIQPDSAVPIHTDDCTVVTSSQKSSGPQWRGIKLGRPGQ